MFLSKTRVHPPTWQNLLKNSLTCFNVKPKYLLLNTVGKKQDHQLFWKDNKTRGRTSFLEGCKENEVKKGEKIVTRFAPSPTGFLHLGALRTALFNYLYAKKHGENGTFILRIEDTDQKRFVQGSVEQIKETLNWCGLRYDEMYVQSERTKLYQSYAYQLLESGHAYKCYCTEQRLKVMKENGEAKYDRHCLSLSRNEIQALERDNTPFVIRMKIPYSDEYDELMEEQNDNSLDGMQNVENNHKMETTQYIDNVFGKINVKNCTIDDQVLLKSDGFPTYHLANVVDDHLMNVTHVIRGMEWISSTPKHVILYNMFGWKVPSFTHLPLLCTPDHQKLSKRLGHASVDWYRMEGFIPEALINFVAYLGWNPRDDRDIMTMNDLLQNFSLENLGKANSVVDLKKLEWLNSQHIQRAIQQNTADVIHQFIRPRLCNTFGEEVEKQISDQYLSNVLNCVKERIKNYNFFCTYFDYFFKDVNYLSEEAKNFAKKIKKIKERKKITEVLIEKLSLVDFTSEESITQVINEVKNQFKIPYSDVVQVLRYSITGHMIGASISPTLSILGKETCLKRLANAPINQ